MVGWPDTDEELVRLQEALGVAARDAAATRPWEPTPGAIYGGCFVAFARGEAGPGRPGDRAWAAAVAWRDGQVLGHTVVAGTVPAAYQPGLLARREGPILAAAVDALAPVPDVLLVDATGADHPRGAGLAIHLGAVLELPTVGVTHRGLVARGDPPPLARRGDDATVVLDGKEVGRWVCTRSGARPVLAHAGWRTTGAIARTVVLAASTQRARTPVPLQEARRFAREKRADAQPADDVR